jgi:predicted outer membrane repeat protein
MNKSITFFTAALVLLVAVMLHVRPAYAADAVVGNGAPASCSEAAFDGALAMANSGGGTITFHCGAATKTITFSSQKSILTEDVTIDGDNRIILSGGGVTRHFFVNGGLTFRLQRITLRDGNSPVGGGAIESAGAQVVLESVQVLANNAKDQGGAIYCYVGTGGTLTINNSRFEQNTALKGGAIYNDGCAATINNSTFQTNKGGAVSSFGGAVFNAPTATLTVNNSRFKGNSALDGGALYIDSGAIANLNAVTLEANSGGYGGGVENSGAVTITDSLLNLNLVTGSGGGIWNLGGTVTLQRTTVSNNSAFEGGGINSYGNHLQISDANITGNIATGTHGGGIFHNGGTAFITNATISGNMANASAANGGGIYQNSDGNLTLTNATLMNNQAGLFGGGFYHFGRYAILTNVTIGNNQAGAAGSAIYEDSPMTPANPGVIQMVNSVIYGSANNCDGPAFQSLGHNISKGACSSLSAGSDQDNFAGDLKVGGLIYNGGAFPMQTSAPLAGSPLIDAGDAAQCRATDQRGAPRVGVCDIGAVEYGAILPLLYLPIVVR